MGEVKYEKLHIYIIKLNRKIFFDFLYYEKPERKCAQIN